MKVIKNLFSSFYANKPNDPRKVQLTKMRLAGMSQKQLQTALTFELRKEDDVWGRLGLRKSVPTTIQALSELHRGATYMKQSWSDPKVFYRDYQTVYVNKWTDAQAFVNKRDRAVSLNLPTPLSAVNLAAHNAPTGDAQYAPAYLIHLWAANVAGAQKPVAPPKVTFGDVRKKPVYQTPPKLEARTASSSSIDRGGLSFAPGEPVTIANLVAKLAKVEGKKAQR